MGTIAVPRWLFALVLLAWLVQNVRQDGWIVLVFFGGLIVVLLVVDVLLDFVLDRRGRAH